MKHPLLPTLAALTLVATTGCSEASEPTAVETEVLVASATAWTPADLTRDLQVDDVTKQKIEDGVQALHASMVELHEMHGTAERLEAGAARDAYVANLKADMQRVHEQHRHLWESLDPAVQEQLTARFHEQMGEHDGGTIRSVHEWLRRLHGGDDNAGH